MSGHSKWATIHRQKEVTDQKKGQVFTKLANAIIIAIRDSGGITDPANNFKLRLALEKAKTANMPKDNIQRAIDRAVGKTEGAVMTEVSYEGYGPGGVGFIVEAVTDNKQRTVQEVKNAFDKSGGGITSPGAVAFNFQKTGLVTIETDDKEEAMLKAIDLGAEDVKEAANGLLEVYGSVNNLESLKERLNEAGFVVKSVEIVMKPINLVEISDQKIADRIWALIEKLESLDDVQKVYTNYAFN